MTFAFQNPNASITSLSFAGDHPDADAVKRAIRSYFTSKDARIFLGNVYTIITFFCGGLGDEPSVSYRERLMVDPDFAEKVRKAEGFFCAAIENRINENEFSADIWWEMIQSLMKEFDAPDVERDMFIEDTPAEPLSDEIPALSPTGDIVSILDRSDLFETCIMPDGSFHLEKMLSAFADKYICDNYDTLAKQFDELVAASKIQNDFARFLKDVHRCAGEALFCAIAELDDVCDPFHNYMDKLDLQRALS